LARKILLSIGEIDEGAKSRLISSLPEGWDFKNEKEIRDEELPNVEILFGRLLPAEKLGLMKDLKLLQTFSAGVDWVDFTIIPAGVIVCSNAGAFGGPIGEFVAGAVISLARDFREHDQEMREGKFGRTPPGVYLKGKTIGIIGTGGIGQNVARIAKSLGMKTLGVNTTGKAVPNFDEVIDMDKLHSVLQKSDVVVVAVPLTVKTKDLLGRDEFNVMKPSCIVVNVARGAIINQEAIYNFLHDHPHAKAALDVWWRYPKTGEETVSQDYPISQLSNVLSMPHFSDGVEDQLKIGCNSAVDNILRYLRNEPLKGIVDRNEYIGLNVGKAHP
jgi:phosphoglycerate dehydrogenase-like enzyme